MAEETAGQPIPQATEDVCVHSLLRDAFVADHAIEEDAEEAHGMDQLTAAMADYMTELLHVPTTNAHIEGAVAALRMVYIRTLGLVQMEIVPEGTPDLMVPVMAELLMMLSRMYFTASPVSELEAMWQA